MSDSSVETDGLVEFLTAEVDEDDRIARDASGSTVVGEPGHWTPAPGGDEWEVSRDAASRTLELVVALRPALTRPPAPTSGYWGVVTDWEDEGYGYGEPTEEFAHMARHDPSRALREVAAKRRIMDRHSRGQHAR